MENRRESEFGCIRFHNSPFSRLATEAGNLGCMATDGTISASAFAAAEGTGERYLRAAMDASGGMPAEYYVLCHLLTQQVILHAVYVSAGRQVFQFTPAILDEFKRTDLSETPIGRLILPYPAGFLQFGRQSDLALDDQWRTEAEYVDGAYFHCGPQGQLSIQLTLSRPENTWSGMCGPKFSIDADGLTLPAHQAIDNALDRDQQDSGMRGADAALKDWDEAARPVVHAALSLVLNALFYLDAYGADTEPTVPAAAPESLREAYTKAVKEAKPKALRNARNTLMADGFAVVRLCGASIASGQTPDTGDGSGHSVRIHWRRGHWRMQPCGPKLSQIKRVWVRPALVGKDAGGALKGHIYSVVDPPPVTSTEQAS